MAFIYKLEHEDGTRADPPTIRSAPGVSRQPGDTIPLGHGRTLRVLDTRLPAAPDEDAVLVVETRLNGHSRLG